MNFGYLMMYQARYGMWLCGLAACLILSLTACKAVPLAPTPTDGALLVSPTLTTALSLEPTAAMPLPSTTPQATSLPTQTPVPTASPTPAPIFYEPAGCWQPPDDYTRLQVNGYELNARTYAMLQQAARLYGGVIDVAGKAVIQGSYNNGFLDRSDSHLGGGAVDLAVTGPNPLTILYTDIEPLIRALRTVGFAAWLREDEKMRSGAGLFIHAIAIGDKELSPAAQEELNGLAGYLRGYDGLPVNNGKPVLDRYGGPLICRWMLAAGYADLRTPTMTTTAGPAWQERLRQAAQAYVAEFPEDAEKVARSLHFLDGKNESATNICGPLSAAILRDAGLLPDQPGPVQDLKSYWQARPITNGRPWSLFSMQDYEVFHYDTPLAEFDFTAWPLKPADFLYTYAKDGGFEHMFVVTEVDSEGRAYTVTNQYQGWGSQLWGNMLILRYMLYDPHDPGAGIIYNEWSNPRLGTTGRAGFDVLRKRGLEAGTLFDYTIRPGDTLPELAARYGARPESIVQANPGLDLANLQVGQPLIIPIPPYTPGTLEPTQNTLP